MNFSADENKTLFSKLRFRDLHLLKEISLTRSLTTLADKYGISQPALSRSLRDIEIALGVQVFSRDRGSALDLTPVGRHILERVDFLIADANALHTQLRAYKEGNGSQVRLGVIPYISNSLLLAIVRKLTNDPLCMSVSTYEGSTDQLISALRRRELDAVLGRISVDGSHNELIQEKLFSQTASIVVSEAMDNKKKPSLGALHNYPWVLPPANSPTRLAFVSAFVSQNANVPTACIETTSARLVHSAITEKMASFGFVPMGVGREIEAWGGVRCWDFPAPFQMPTVGLIMLSKSKSLTVNKVVRDVVHDAIAHVPTLI